jgi:copper oxidase (laccase) domain-containing protein
MTADCLPLLITDEQGSCIAAIHAGWRGLCDGIIETTIKKLPVEPESLLI